MSQSTNGSFIGKRKRSMIKTMDPLPPCMSVQYTGGCAVQRGIFSTQEGYHEHSGGRSFGKQLNLHGNPSVLNIPGVLMISPTLIMLHRGPQASVMMG